MPDDRQFYGYRLRSDVLLASLPILPRAARPDIVLRSGPVAPDLVESTWASPFVQVGSDGTVLIRAGDRLRFRVTAGADIVIDASHDTPSADIDMFLLGAVAGAVFHQRGDFVLHASCVEIDHRAVAIVGPSGRGKSTAAAALVARGHRFVSDDVCLVRFTDGGSVVTPGPPRMRLWPDAIDTLAFASTTIEQGRPRHPKRVVVPPTPIAAPLPLAAIVRLAVDARHPEGHVQRLRGPDSVMPIGDMVYRLQLGRRLGRGPTLFRDLVRLADSTPVFQLLRHDQLPPSRVADLIATTAAAVS